MDNNFSNLSKDSEEYKTQYKAYINVEIAMDSLSKQNLSLNDYQRIIGNEPKSKIKRFINRFIDVIENHTESKNYNATKKFLKQLSTKAELESNYVEQRLADVRSQKEKVKSTNINTKGLEKISKNKSKSEVSSIVSSIERQLYKLHKTDSILNDVMLTFAENNDIAFIKYSNYDSETNTISNSAIDYVDISSYLENLGIKDNVMAENIMNKILKEINNDKQNGNTINVRKTIKYLQLATKEEFQRYGSSTLSNASKSKETLGRNTKESSNVGEGLSQNNSQIEGKQLDVRKQKTVEYSDQEFEDGTPMTKEQVKFIEGNHKITYDENGNQKLYYHGSDMAGFMEFNDSGNNVIFLTNYDRASTYTRNGNMVFTRKFKNFKEATDWWYLDKHEGISGYEEYDLLPKSKVHNIINEELETLKRLLDNKNDISKALKDIIYNNRLEYYNKGKLFLIDDEGLIQEAYSTINELNANLARNLQTDSNIEQAKYESSDYYEYEEDNNINKTNNVYGGYISLKNPVVINARGKNFMRIPYRGVEMTTDDIAKLIKSEVKNDGVVFKNIMDNGARDRENDLGLGEVTVIFSSNQFKAIDNETPDIKNKDIRYQKEIDSEGNKVYAMPTEAKEIFNKYYSKWETIERVSVKKLINDNYLNDPIKQSSVESRRSKTWGNSSSEYKFDTDKADIESIKYQSAITIRKDENGKYILRDGNHRVIALNNEGYKYVDALKAKSSDTRYQKSVGSSENRNYDEVNDNDIRKENNEYDFRGIQEESKRFSNEELQRYRDGSRQISDELYGRLSNIFKRELEARRSSNGNSYGILNLEGKGNSFKVYTDVI